MQLRALLRGALKDGDLVPQCNLLQLQGGAAFQTDEVPARNSASHPQIKARTLRMR
jgi:hypothetical protein